MYGYIYLTTNLINGRKYIGQHTSSEFDPNYKGSGKILWQAINKYGWDNFSVRMLCPCFSQDELDAEEILLIKYFDAVNSEDYYNLQAGGQKGNIRGSRLSESTRRKQSISQSGRKHSKATKLKISQANKGLQNWKGKHHTEETKRKISEAQLGPKNHAYGKQLSQEVRDKISKSMQGSSNPFYGRHHSAETIEKIRSKAGHSGESNPMYGKISPNRNKVYIHKGDDQLIVAKDELDKYIELGWTKGRRPRIKKER